MRWVVLPIAWIAFAGHPAVGASTHPSFDCSEAVGTVEQLICADSALTALDVQLERVWHEVLERSADNVDIDLIRAEQRGWIKGRNDCWKSDEVRQCVLTSYRLRIAELQARWRLVPQRGPFFFFCDDSPANEVIATYFDTDPPAAVLERGDQTVIAFLEPAASGSLYQGRNVTFWTKDDEATLTWGWEAPRLRCEIRPSMQDQD